MTATTRDEIKVGEMVIRFLLEGQESSSALAIFEFEVPSGAKIAAPHSHDGYDETIYGLEGTLTWTLGGVPIDVGPGDTLFIPRGAVHHFDNTHGADAKALAIATPGVIGPEFFREVATVLGASAGGPPDAASLGDVMRRHGLTPAPPAERPSES